MILVCVCKHMIKFAQSRAVTVIENLFFPQVCIVQLVYFSRTPNEDSVVQTKLSQEVCGLIYNSISAQHQMKLLQFQPNFFYDYLDRYE